MLSEPVEVRAVQRADFPDWKQLSDGYNARAGSSASRIFSIIAARFKYP
jgi:hypothetical protein